MNLMDLYYYNYYYCIVNLCLKHGYLDIDIDYKCFQMVFVIDIMNNFDLYKLYIY